MNEGVISVQDNILKKDISLKKLKDHCLCLEVDGDVVYLPDGYGVDALLIDETASGYERAERKLEEIWKNSLL